MQDCGAYGANGGKHDGFRLDFGAAHGISGRGNREFPRYWPAPRLDLRLADASPLAWQTLTARKTALFFFCPCEACHKVAELWAKQERAKPPSNPSLDSVQQRLIVFAGDAEAVQRFQAETGLGSKFVRYACDPNMKAALRYDAMPCPRVFVWEAGGKICWISPENTEDNTFLSPQSLLQTVDSVFTADKKVLSPSRRK